MRRVLLAGLSTAILAACGEPDVGVESEVPEPERYGGTAVVASLSEVNSMNHFVSIDDISQQLQAFVLFAPLIQYNSELEPIPYLAESWDTTAIVDGIALTFHLRDDVKWHDGVATTANDVKFTFDRIKDPATAYPNASVLAAYDSARVEDALTITFFLKPHIGFLDAWRMISPMPQHILGDVAPADLKQHPFGTESPVGNGPFRFVEHRAGDRWVFEANPDFPEALGGRPYLDRLVYRFVEEPTVRLAELLAGNVDAYLVVSPSHVEQIDADPTTKAVTYPNRAYHFINWNCRLPFFADAQVRRALTLAINRHQIVEAVLLGLGEVAKGPVPPFHWAFNAQLQPLPYDPDSARTLLEASGWTDSDGDGVRERGSQRASFELKTNPHPTREDIMTLVQRDLAEVGIEVRTRVQEAQSMGADITGSERRFEAFVLGWTTEFNSDDRVLFACSALDGPFQWSGYCNPRVDELLDELSSIQDRSTALPLWYEYQEIIQRDQPYTFLYYGVQANGVSHRLRNVEMDIRGDFVNAREWYVAPGH